MLLEPPQAPGMATEQAPGGSESKSFLLHMFSSFIGCGRLQPASCERVGFLIVGTLTPAASCRFTLLPNLSLFILRTWETSSVFCHNHVKFRGSCRLGSVFAEFVNQCLHSGHARGKAIRNGSLSCSMETCVALCSFKEECPSISCLPQMAPPSSMRGCAGAEGVGTASGTPASRAALCTMSRAIVGRYGRLVRREQGVGEDLTASVAVRAYRPPCSSFQSARWAWVV